MKKIAKYIWSILLLVLFNTLSTFTVHAQCPADYPVLTGTLTSYEIDFSSSITNIYWYVSVTGTIVGDRTRKAVDIQWNQPGPATVSVVYYVNGVETSRCWSVSVRDPINGGTINGAVSTFVKNQIFSYAQLTSVTPASGGVGQDYGSTYTYQWEESVDGNTWTPITGASGANATGSSLLDRKIYFRRRVTDSYATAYSNILTVDVIPLLNGGLIGTSQRIVPGATPAKLTSTVTANGGNGSYNYQWESSSDEQSWNTISGATASDYQPGALSQTTYFRKKVVSGGQASSTNVVQVLVKAAVTANIPDATAVGVNQSKIAPPNYTAVNTANLNSITTYAVLKPGIKNTSQIQSLTSKRDLSIAVEYVDGLRRPLETIEQEAGYASQDLVSLSRYDQYGRQTLQHLPYLATTSATSKGTFRTDVNTSQPAFYNTLTQNKEDFFYSQSNPEPSPLSRSTKSVLPGKSYGGNNIGTSTLVRTNNADEHIRLWRVGNAVSDVPVSNTEYEAATLTVTVITDAENIRSYQYTDREGKIVMSSRQGATAYYRDELRTYYVYDDLGNIRYIIPPLATKGWWDKTSWDFGSSTETRTALKELAYKYYYDAKGRVVTLEKAGMDYAFSFVYDNRNRVVFVQDATLKGRNAGEWILYLYDGMDRVRMTALYTNTSATRESLQSAVDQAGGNTTVTVKTPAPKDLYVYQNENKPEYVASNAVVLLPGFDSGDNAEISIYVNAAANEVTENLTVHNVPTGITGYTPLMIYYYDDYNWNGAKVFDKGYSLSAGSNPYPEVVSSPSNNIYGKLTGYKKSIPGTTEWINSTLYYDDKGRTIQQLETNIKGGTDVTTNLYDFTGRVLSSFSRLTNPASTTDPVIYIQERMEYDNNGNVQQKYHSVSRTLTPQPKLVSGFTFDDLNRVKSINLGQGLETVQYDYDLFGRLKAMNASYTTDKMAGNYFGMELFYDNGFTQRKLDGNISGVIWRRKGNGDPAHAYGYSYDTHNRLIKADYTQKGGSSWTNSEEDYTTAISQYDENGNIVRMKEEGMLPGKAKATIDDLTYDYKTTSNRLRGVTDAKGDKKLGDFKNYSGRISVDDYTYDATGNLTGDKNRGITITYDHLLGKPRKISFNNDANKYITYTREITGSLLERTVKNGTVVYTYTYINGAVYKDNVLQYVLFDEGRVRKVATGNFVYDYYLTDQVGNTRTVITEETNQYYYKATHEDNPSPVPVLPEREQFSFPPQLDNIPAGHKFYDYNGTANRKFVKLNYTDPNRRIGTGKVLRVMAGDQLDLGVLAYYQVNSPDNNTGNNPINEILSQLVSVLLGPATIIDNGKSNLLLGTNGIILNQQDFSTFIGNNQTSNPASTVPKAYLNYALFDDNFQFVNGSAVRVSSPGDVVALATQVSVNKNGYLYVYVSNESNTDVYFDDLVVKHTTGHLLQEDSYYPFGLQIQGLSSMALNRPQNDYLFNGIEKVSDFDLQLYEAFYRTFDPQTGRWLQVDPVAEKYHSLTGYNNNFNNPVNFTDPLGDDPPWWMQFFMGRGMDGNSPILLDVVEVVAPKVSDGTILLKTFDVYAKQIVRIGAAEQAMTFTTSSYLALEAAEKRQKAFQEALKAHQQALKMKELASTLQKIYGKMPYTPAVEPGSIKEYVPDWKDKWAASDNFFAEATYEPIDGAWTTIQSLNPFLSRSAISHIGGEMATETDRVGGLVNVTTTVVSDHVGGIAAKAAFKAVIPILGKVVSGGSRGLWKLTKEGASAIKFHKTFGTFYKSVSDGLWWAVDRAGHGGSKFKVFRETKEGLEWIADADEFGDFIIGKHKGDTGKSIPWNKLISVK